MKQDTEILNSSWIWLPCPEGKARHQYVCFRKTFDLGASETNAVLDLSVDSDFVLFINGHEIGCGQFSDYPREKTYTRFDVKLRGGRNCIAVLAYHRGEDFSDHRAGKPGLIVSLNGGAARVLSDGTWKCIQHPAFVSGDMPRVTWQQGFTTCFDARKDIPWTDIDFDDAHWKSAEVQSGALSGFWREIMHRPVPMLTQGEPVDSKVFSQGYFRRRQEYGSFAETMANDMSISMPENVVFGDTSASGASSGRIHSNCRNFLLRTPAVSFEGACFIIDFGREETGLIQFALEAPAGTVIDIGHGEHVIDGQVRMRIGARNFADRYICREGANTYTLPFRRIGARYMQVHISNYSVPLKISYFGLIPLSLPGIDDCEFRTSDTLAEKIHGISVRTLKCCMHEHYEDSPWREQALYAFDGRNQALYGYQVFGNYDFAATSLSLLGRGIRADGLLELCAPAKVPITIPMFSLIWITALAEHWMYSGSNALFAQFSGQIKNMLDVVFARKDSGTGLYMTPDLPEMWHFYEWAPDLVNWPESPTANSAFSKRFDAPWNLFLHETLGAYSQMLRLSGNDQVADEIAARRRQLGDSIAKVFWDDEKQCMSTFVSNGERSGLHQLVQCMTINEHVLDTEREKSLLRKITRPEFHPMTLSSMLYLVRALMARDDESRRVVASIIHDNWEKMVLSGASTCWETIDGESAFDGAGSLCHGWSALPVYYYHAYVLGVRPLSPGFKTFSVDPYCDHFKDAKGSVMTPYGKITVEWSRKGDGIALSVKHPTDCEQLVSSWPTPT